MPSGYLSYRSLPWNQPPKWNGVQTVPGPTLGVTMARRKSLRRQWEKDQADNRQAELNECAQRAQRALKHMPSSKQEFIESEIASLRSTLFSICLKHLDAACEFHGYRFTTQSKEAVLMAVDVLVDELACGDVVFDAERHEQIIAKHRASIRCADLQFENHLQALTALNPTLLEGELQ